MRGSIRSDRLAGCSTYIRKGLTDQEYEQKAVVQRHLGDKAIRSLHAYPVHRVRRRVARWRDTVRSFVAAARLIAETSE
jgi:hypothetical protein